MAYLLLIEWNADAEARFERGIGAGVSP